MREKRYKTWYRAAWILIFTFISMSCQSSLQATVPMQINGTAEVSPSSTPPDVGTTNPSLQEIQETVPAAIEVSPVITPSLIPGPTSTPTVSQETFTPEQDSLYAVLEPSVSAEDCAAAGVPESACTGVAANVEWSPVIREFGGIPMALVPAGCFTMGSTDEQVDQYLAMKDLMGLYVDEQPAHPQCIQEPFWIDVYEVTNDFYGSVGWYHDNDQPRESVNWYEANSYCISRGARLPSEVEWEYAARGPDNLVYPWGNTFDGSLLNYCDYNCQDPGADTRYNDGYNITAPVGSYPGGASWVGALDMAGNVWEWISTDLQPYPYQPDDGREASQERLSSSLRMVRGGGRLDPDYAVRSTNRNERLTHNYDTRFGMRCARSFNPATDGDISPQARPELLYAPPSSAEFGDTWTRPRDGAVMLFVTGGTFQMGTGSAGSASSDSNESPEHPVQVDSYWIDKYPVNNKQYAEFMNYRGNIQEGGVTWVDLESGSSMVELHGRFYFPKMTFEDHPVTGVSWYGAQAYCDWNGGRLLTEAEWEYAASGPENRLYPWGNEYDCTLGNFQDSPVEEGSASDPGERGCDGFDRTSLVYTYPGGASWVGALDLAGNVWDWVWDWGISTYPSGLQVNPTGLESGTEKVVRGGSWDDYSLGVRTTMRGSFPPTVRSPYIGFRCAYPVGP